MINETQKKVFVKEWLAIVEGLMNITITNETFLSAAPLWSFRNDRFWIWR